MKWYLLCCWIYGRTLGNFYVVFGWFSVVSMVFLVISRVFCVVAYLYDVLVCKYDLSLVICEILCASFIVCQVQFVSLIDQNNISIVP